MKKSLPIRYCGFQVIVSSIVDNAPIIDLRNREQLGSDHIHQQNDLVRI